MHRLRPALGALAARLAEELDGRRRTALPDLLDKRRAAPAPDPGTPVTDLLHARLAPGDRAAVVTAMAGSSAELHAAADEATRRRLEINHAAAFGPDTVRERLGLRSAMPPDEVHSMARTWMTTGGDTFLADLVVAALEAADCPLPAGGTVLDFGSSSGRVLRILASARPDLRCLGCDPNAGAIAWASAHLPGEYFVSPLAPPLDLPEACLDAAFAVSIWSHFAERPALDWLGEMARVVRPGGALVLTTHGWDALAVRLRRRMMGRPAARLAAEALIVRGHHFVDVFGPDGDWGVRDAGWGDAYLTADWLATHVAGHWSLELLWPAAIDATQDLFVLRRR